MKHLALLLIILIIAKPLSAQTCLVTLDSRTHVTCRGGSDGKLKVEGAGINGVLSYKWSTGATTKEITNLSAGWYSVTVTCFYGPAVGVYQITEPGSIQFLYTQNNVRCAGEKTGSISHRSTFGGVGPYSYLWNNGAKTSSISNLSAGKYNLTITDSKGCTKDYSFNITQPSKLTISTLIKDDLTCFQSNDGRIEVNGAGGVPPYSYLWSTGHTTKHISNLAKGTYRVSVTDNNGCLNSGSYSITEPTEVGYSNLIIEDVDCHGASTGSISLEGKGGNPSYSYAWSNGSSTNKISGLKANKYTVSITDRNKCQKSFTFVVDEPSELNASLIKQTHILCHGDATGLLTVDGKGGTPPYSYSWNNGETSSTISKLKAGKYEVTILDENKCEVIEVYTIAEPDELQVQVNALDHNPCFDESKGSITVTPRGGISPYQFQWTHGPTTNKISGLKAGTYSLIITDANGCKYSEAYDIYEPEQLSVEPITIVHNPCFGQRKGSIQIDVLGGTGPYEIKWNNGATGPQIQNLVAGQYSADITDANGCTTQSTFDISEPELLDIKLLTLRNNGCGESEEGKLKVEPVGGTPPFNYQWSNGGTQAEISRLIEGRYTVLITDVNGCTTSQSYTIQQQEDLQIDTLMIVDNPCHAQSDGSIEVIINNGTGPLSYIWSNGDTTQQINGLMAGEYRLEVVDATGCKRNDTFEVTQPEKLEALSLQHMDVLCQGESNGLIELEAQGGVAPHKFSWSNGESTSLISRLEANEYTVEVSDANDCLIRDTFQINEPELLEIVITEIKPDGGSGTGAISIELEGGTPGYTVDWSGPNGFSSDREDITDLEPGIYTCQVWDEHQCETILDSIEVEKLTSVKSNDLVQFEVYPNPTHSEVNVVGLSPSTEISIIDVLGTQKAFFPTYNGQSIPIKAIVEKTGVYFILAQIDGEVYSKRLIVK